MIAPATAPGLTYSTSAGKLSAAEIAEIALAGHAVLLEAAEAAAAAKEEESLASAFAAAGAKAAGAAAVCVGSLSSMMRLG